MLSQFSREGKRPTLADLKFCFPKKVYPVGRLDADSEGLLILTNDKTLTEYLLNPIYEHTRTYLVQTEQIPTIEAIQALQNGVTIRIDNKLYCTKPAQVRLLQEEPVLPVRIPPIRYRAHIPTAWLEIKLKEGKNRQIRKMTASVGFPTLRLVRYAIEHLTIEKNMIPGSIVEWKAEDIKKLLLLK